MFLDAKHELSQIMAWHQRNLCVT